jgi:hypothetical protein
MKKIILLALFAWTSNNSALDVRAAENTNQTPAVAAPESDVTTNSQPRSEENLGYDVVDGKTNKIGSIYKVTPSYVHVIYDPSTRGRKIPRQELPPELKAKFPYDATQAAEYQKQQMALAAQQAAIATAAAREAAKTAAIQREREIQNEIARLQAQDVAIQKEVNVLKSLAPGNGRRVQLAQLRNQLQAIRERVSKLRTQLEQLQAQRDRTP